MFDLPVVQIGSVTMDGVEPVFMLGPCVIESEAFIWDVAEKIDAMARQHGWRWIFKASYDKANRSAISSYRGIGCEAGCALLAKVGERFGVPVTTDIHTPEEAHQAAKYIDLLQIPAFLCRQTDLIVAAGETGRAVRPASASSTSLRTMRPAGPEPCSWPRSNPDSSAIFRASGDANTRDPFVL